MQTFICHHYIWARGMREVTFALIRNFSMTLIGNMLVIGNMTVTIDLEVGRGAKVDVA